MKTWSDGVQQTNSASYPLWEEK